MIELARLLTEICLVWLIITLVASWLFSAAYPLLRQLVAHTSPDKRASSILIYALLTPVAAALVLVLIMQPQWSGVLLFNHCHDTVCGPHTPTIETTSPLGAALVSIATLVVAVLLSMIFQNVQWSRQRILTLHALSHRASNNRAYRVVDSDALLAWCGGLWHSQIYLSRGLLSRLNTEQLQVVLAHEHAHAIRRDNLQRTVLHWATVFWPGALKASIRNDFSTASELVCDQAAVRKVNDVALVESVIRMLAGHAGQRSTGSNTAFAAHSTLQYEHRLQALGCQSNKQSFANSGWLLMTLLWIIAVALLTRISHPVLEWLV